MVTIKERNNENQYSIALQGLNDYNALIGAVVSVAVDYSNLDDKIAEANKQIRKLNKTIKALSGTSGIEDSIAGLQKNKAKFETELQTYITQRESGEQAQDVEAVGSIEYILNSTTTTDLILPVKKSDLEKPLAGQIYSSVEEICKAYKSTQMVFEEYLGFSLANVDQTELTARVGATLNQLGVTALAADNFSFTYNVVAKGIAEVAVPAPVVNEPIVSPTPEPVAPVQEPIVPATLEPVAEPALEEKVKQAAPKGDPKPLTGQIKPAPSEGLDGRTYISSAPELHQALDSVRNDILAAPDLKYDIVAERFQVVIKDFDLTDGTPKAKGKMAGYIANRVKRWNLEATAK